MPRECMSEETRAAVKEGRGGTGARAGAGAGEVWTEERGAVYLWM